MPTSFRFLPFRATGAFWLPAFALLTAAAPLQAQSNDPLFGQNAPFSAQNGPSRNQQLLRAAAGLFDIGGYFYTDRSAKDALGSTKFASNTQLFVRPKYYGKLTLTGGLQIASANDHFFPFSNQGNDFSLIGPAFRVSTYRVLYRPRPFVTGGLFLGRVRSERQGFDRSNFTPSISAGVEYPFARYFTLVGAYRISQRIHDVNTDGVSVMLRFF